MRKIRFFLLLLGLVYLVGCGGSDDLTGGGPGVPQDPGLVPPGTVINTGTGPVLSEDEAIARVLSQFLGLAPLEAQARAVRVGQGTEPFLNAFIVPGGPFGAGTTVTDWDEPGLFFTTDQPYYFFWVDPAPNANLGHPCSILYLRAGDGLLVQQEVDFDPIVGGQRLLEGDAAKENNLIYTHEVWERLGYASFQARLLDVEQLRGVGEPGGPAIGGLGVAGALEGRRDADMQLGRETYRLMGGEPADFDVLDDDEGSRIDAFDLEEALAEASKGLGPNDKFLFVLSSHGSPRGTFQVGTDSLTWELLCELIDQNVTAGNVNLVLDTCYSGLAVEGFAAWEGKSNKRVRIITSTGVATPSYSKSNGAGFSLECIVEKLRDRILDYGTNDASGELTLEELEQAMTEVDVSAEEIRQKLCEFLGDVPGADVPQAVLDWKADYDDDTRGPVEGSDGTRKSGFDDRPPPAPEILKFLQDWALLVEAKDVPGLTPFYVPDFLYNGQTVTQVNRLGGTAQIDVVSLGNLVVQPPTLVDSFFDIRYDLVLKRTQTGTTTIDQEERHHIRMRLEPKTGSGYEIETQQSLTQDTTGTLTTGAPPPVPPALPGITSLTLTGPNGPVQVGDPVQPGDLLTVRTTVTGLTGGNVGFTFAGQLLTLQPQGGGVFVSAPFPAPDRQPGFFLLSLFAENRTVVTPGQVESFGGQTQTQEVVYPSATPGGGVPATPAP